MDVFKERTLEKRADFTGKMRQLAAHKGGDGPIHHRWRGRQPESEISLDLFFEAPLWDRGLRTLRPGALERRQLRHVDLHRMAPVRPRRMWRVHPKFPPERWSM